MQPPPSTPSREHYHKRSIDGINEEVGNYNNQDFQQLQRPAMAHSWTNTSQILSDTPHAKLFPTPKRSRSDPQISSETTEKWDLTWAPAVTPLRVDNQEVCNINPPVVRTSNCIDEGQSYDVFAKSMPCQDFQQLQRPAMAHSWTNTSQILSDTPHAKLFPTPKRSRSDPQISSETTEKWDLTWAPAVTPLRVGNQEVCNINPPVVRTSNYIDEGQSYDVFAKSMPCDINFPFVTPARTQNIKSRNMMPFRCPIDATSKRHVNEVTPPFFKSETWLSNDQGRLDDLDTLPTNKFQSASTQSSSHYTPTSVHLSHNSLEDNQSRSIPNPSPLLSLDSTLYSKGQKNLFSSSFPSVSAAVDEAKINDNPPAKLNERRFNPFHAKRWNEHLSQLREFKAKFSHCLVPHTFDENQNLARWVKRQRRQYKLMKEGDITSTMTQFRIGILNAEGFVWDSHEVVWRERFEELSRYKEQHDHCCVPSHCKDEPQLGSWVKCQRRHYKLFWDGKPSSITTERMQKLENIGFMWEMRSRSVPKNRRVLYKKMAEALNKL